MSKSLSLILREGLSGQFHDTLADYLYGESLFNGDLVCGAQLWEKIYNLETYYVPKEEIKTIHMASLQLRDILKDYRTFVDLAPGTRHAIGDKTLPFLKKSGFFKKYIAMDSSKAFLKESCQVIKKAHPEISILLREKNIFSSGLRLQDLGPVFGFLSGGTIGNLDPIRVFRILKMWKESIAKESSILITQDSTQDKDKLLKAYGGQVNSDFALNVFYRIQRDLSLPHFAPTAFRYLAEWNPKILAVEMFGIATKRQDIEIDDILYTIEKDFPIPIVRSYKLPPEIFLDKAHQAGFEPVKSFHTPDSGVYMHLLRKPRAVGGVISSAA